jgi:hypothetical protein
MAPEHDDASCPREGRMTEPVVRIVQVVVELPFVIELTSQYDNRGEEAGYKQVFYRLFGVNVPITRRTLDNSQVTGRKVNN